MRVKQLPYVNGIARADIDGRIAVRAIDVSRAELPNEDEIGSNVRQIFKNDHPEAVVAPPSGHGLPTGHYVYETHLGELIAYHKDTAVIQAARERAALGKGHGAGIKKGKRTTEIAFDVEVDGKVLNITGTVQHVRNLVEKALRENSSLSGFLDVERRKVELLTRQRDKAFAEIRDMLDEGFRQKKVKPAAVPSVLAPAPAPVSVPASASVAKTKPRFRAVNGQLVPVGEVWKRIPALPIFEVSNFGRFRRNGVGGRIIPVNPKNSMSYVSLWKRVDGRRVTVSANAALLVADAFCPNKPGPYLSFKDRNRRNIHADNLEWLPENSPKRHETDVRPRAGRAQEIAA